MTPTMRVPVRYTVRYTELGDSYTGEGESPHKIYNQVYRAGDSYTGGGGVLIRSTFRNTELGDSYTGGGGSLTVVFGWRSVAEEPVLLTC